MQRLKALFGRKRPVNAAKTHRKPLPSDPDFDIQAWLAEHPENEDENAIDLVFPSARALRMGISCCVTPEQDSEQQGQWAEMQRQKEANQKKSHA